MGKIRINKLALELNVQNDQILDALHNEGIPAKNYMSSIDEEAANFIRELFTEDASKKDMGKTAKGKSVSAKAKSPARKKDTGKTETEKKAPEKEREKKSGSSKIAAKKKIAKEGKEETEEKKGPRRGQRKPPEEEDAEDLSSTDVDVLTEGEPEAPVRAVKVQPSRKGAQVRKQEPVKAPPPKKHGLKVIKAEEKPKIEEKKPAAPKVEEKPHAEKETKVSKPKTPHAPTPAPAQDTQAATPEEAFEIVQLPDTIPVRDLAEKLKCTANDIIKELMGLGVMATINQSLNFEVASKVSDRRGFEVEREAVKAELDFEEEETDLKEDYIHRPAIVTIMGHVDHGKTSLLDAIRETNITKHEAGGITQHIGAYQVKIKGSAITFLDTPGHEAFTAMRARGAQVTDVVVLVVAADDGIKPQTKEAIDHANAAGVPIMVAINKIDKPDAKPEEVKKQLANLGLLPEDWGGQTIFCEVSALQKTGIDHLLEMILLQSEVLELKANPKIRARGVVIESKLDRGRGPVATIMVQQGALRVGQPFIVGPYFGKVRAMINDKGAKLREALPSTPIEVVGLPSVPQPGDKFIVVNDEKKARQLSNLKIQQKRENQLAQSNRVNMEHLHEQIQEGKIKQLNLILKADVQGSIHAVQEALSKLESQEIRIKVIHEGVGGITESDVLLASASNAIIIGFSVRPTEGASQLAQRELVDVRLYSIIYDAIEDMKKAMDGMLAPKFKEIIMGRAEVRQVFTIPKVGAIAGCQVLSGKMERNLKARLIRDDVVIHEGKISSLRRFKDDVKEVPSGYECGLSFERYQDLKQGDIVEPFVLEEVHA